jgi:hypothetical protein
MQVRVWHWILGFVLCALLGYWLALSAVPRVVPRSHSEESPTAPVACTAQEAMPRFGKGERVARQTGDKEALKAGALEGQRVLIFKDKAAMERFLAGMGSGLRLLGRLDALHALRVGFADEGDLLAGLDGEDLSFIFSVNAPLPVEGSVQPGAVAMGNHLLDWLGISGNNSDAGKGVLIAILDTGVTASPAFASRIRSMNLVDLPSDPAAQNGHGTAVASMIIGNTALSPGVAPGADILSIRIANDNGQSDSFLLAQGIIAAVDAGARLINISFGSEGDSLIVRKALDYAIERGALIAAAAGNNGSDQVSYPAANAGVIAVGSVDALGNHLDFSNTGNSIDLAAPGYGLNAAWSGDQTMSVSGTSFSAPIVIGAIAYIMTEAGAGNLTSAQAYQQLVAYLNDGGAAGKDPELGGGMLDLGRVLNANTAGIYDGAVASSRILAPDAGNPYGQVEILIQNRGTETLINSAVHVSTGSSVVTTNITSLAPNAVQTVRVPVPQQVGVEGSIRVTAQVVLTGGYQDAKPSNDRRVETYVRAGSQ